MVYPELEKVFPFFGDLPGEEPEEAAARTAAA